MDLCKGSKKSLKFRYSMKFQKRKSNIIWISLSTFAAFVVSAFLTFFTSNLEKNFNFALALIFLTFIIFISTILDIVAIAVTVADEKSLHSLSAKK